MKKAYCSKIFLAALLFFLFFGVDSYGQSISNYEFGSGLHFESTDQNYQFDLGGLMLPYISLESFDDDQSSNMFYEH